MGQDPPKQLLEAYTKKNVVALPPTSGSAVPMSWSRKKEPFHVPGRISTSMAFLKLFQFSSTVVCLGSFEIEKQALKKNLNRLQIDNVIKPKIYTVKN